MDPKFLKMIERLEAILKRTTNATTRAHIERQIAKLRGQAGGAGKPSGGAGAAGGAGKPPPSAGGQKPPVPKEGELATVPPKSVPDIVRTTPGGEAMKPPTGMIKRPPGGIMKPPVGGGQMMKPPAGGGLMKPPGGGGMKPPGGPGRPPLLPIPQILPEDPAKKNKEEGIPAVSMKNTPLTNAPRGKRIPNYNYIGSRNIGLHKDKEGKPMYSYDELPRPWAYRGENGEMVAPATPRNEISAAREKEWNSGGNMTREQFDRNINQQLLYNDSPLFRALDRVSGGQMTRNRLLNNEIDQRHADMIARLEAESEARMAQTAPAVSAQGKSTEPQIKRADSLYVPLEVENRTISSGARRPTKAERDAAVYKGNEGTRQPSRAELLNPKGEGVSQIPSSNQGIGVGDLVAPGFGVFLANSARKAFQEGLRGPTSMAPQARPVIGGAAGAQSIFRNAPPVGNVVSGAKNALNRVAGGKIGSGFMIAEGLNELGGGMAPINPDDTSMGGLPRMQARTLFGKMFPEIIGPQNGSDGVSRAGNYMNEWTPYDQSTWGSIARGAATIGGAGEAMLNVPTFGGLDNTLYAFGRRPNEPMNDYAFRTGRRPDFFGLHTLGEKLYDYFNPGMTDFDRQAEARRQAMLASGEGVNFNWEGSEKPLYDPKDLNIPFNGGENAFPKKSPAENYEGLPVVPDWHNPRWKEAALRSR